MLIKKKSTLTGRINELDVNISEEQHNRFIHGEDLDLVAPNLLEFERLFLLTGCLPEDEYDEDDSDFVPIRGRRHNWDD